MDYIIRNVEEKDLKKVAEISVKGWKYAYRGIIDDEYLDSMDANVTYERMKSNYKEGHFIVAADGERILAFCRYSDVYRDNPDDDKIDCELCAIYVDWEIRGNGIGSAIVEFVKNYFKSIGKHTMILWCLRDNMSARAFYEKMGGKEEGLKSFEKGGKTYQEVGYVYDL